jgi:hypothetical protein
MVIKVIIHGVLRTLSLAKDIVLQKAGLTKDLSTHLPLEYENATLKKASLHHNHLLLYKNDLTPGQSRKVAAGCCHAPAGFLFGVLPPINRSALVS